MMIATDAVNRAGTTLPLLLRAAGGQVGAAFALVRAGEYPRLERRKESFLHPRELEVFAALPAEKRRRSYLLGRRAAKSALAPLLGGADPAAIEIRPGAFEQPVVRGPVPEPLEVSISHSETLACAVAFPGGFPMAVDVEELDAKRAAIMKTQVSPGEVAEAAALTGAELTACTLVWTVKEALSKALRCGMTVPFDLLALQALERTGEPGTGAAITGRFRNFGQYKFLGWLGPGFAVSLVLPLRSQLLTDLAPVLAAAPGECVEA